MDYIRVVFEKEKVNLKTQIDQLDHGFSLLCQTEVIKSVDNRNRRKVLEARLLQINFGLEQEALKSLQTQAIRQQLTLAVNNIVSKETPIKLTEIITCKEYFKAVNFHNNLDLWFSFMRKVGVSNTLMIKLENGLESAFDIVRAVEDNLKLSDND